MAKALRYFLVFLLVLCVLAAGWYFLSMDYLPDRVCVYEGERWAFGRGLLTVRSEKGELAPASTTQGASVDGTLYLFDMIPLKTVRVMTVDRVSLQPCGMPFGVKMFTAGVVVASVSQVQTLGGPVCPAKDAGLAPGDVILTVDGVAVSGNEDIAAVVSSSEGRALTVEYQRDGRTATAVLVPANAKNGTGFKAGMWVRDSSAGIGTVTYIHSETGVVAGLGHGITDADSGIVLPVLSGELVSVTVTGVEKGQAGAPGELKGVFSRGAPYATLRYNCESGVFATLNREFCSSQPLPIALRQEVATGKALLLCTVDGGEPVYYDISIEAVNLSDANPTKNLVVRITDPDLIEKTGGIVQGMSGSPIIQNGRIVGALTQVFVNEPTKGYGIVIENMLLCEPYVLDQAKNFGAA